MADVAADSIGESVVRLGRLPVFVAVLECEVRAGGHGILEELCAQRPTVGDVVKHHAARACAFAEDRDLVLVATEQMDISLNPLQSQLLVVDAGVRRPSEVDLVRRQEPEGSKPVVECDCQEAVAVRVPGKGLLAIISLMCITHRCRTAYIKLEKSRPPLPAA